jgi:hypothetical protein
VSPHLRILVAALAVLLAAAPGDAAARPDPPELQAETTAHFVFTFHEPNRPAVRPLVARAEALRARLCTELEVRCFEERVRVHVAASAEEFHATRPGGDGARPPAAHVDWAVGIAYADHDLVLLRIDRLALFDLHDTFVHELSHVVLRKGTDGRFLPRWFVEGVALHQADELALERVQAAARAALTGSLVPLRDLTFRFPATPGRVHLAYAQSLLFFRWLVREVEPDGHVALIRRVAGGEKFEAAFAEVFGDSSDERFAEWSRGLRESSSWIPVLTGTGFLWGLLTFVFVWTWWRKRREMRAILKSWREEDEERARAWYDPD